MYVRHPHSDLLDEHLRYEIDMLRGTFLRLHGTPDQIKFALADQVTAFALMESFATHARGIAEFFRKPEAKLYVERPFTPFKGKDASRFDDLNAAINRQVSHLRFGRTMDEKIGLEERVEIYGLLRAALIEFKGCLKDSYRDLDIGDLPELPVIIQMSALACTTTSICELHVAGPFGPLGPTGPSAPGRAT